MGRGWGGVSEPPTGSRFILKKEATACKPYNSRGGMREGEECACHKSSNTKYCISWSACKCKPVHP